jgi:mono/diheme cytochrome c family protein
LSFTLGSWILEFAGSTGSGFLRAVAAFSLSPALRGLERGLLGSPTALTLLVLGLGFLALSVVWLPPGVSRRQKLVRSGAVFGVAAQALLLVIQLPIYADLSENQRNSFNPADMRELRQMTKELKVNVNLAANDSRLADLDRNVLSKLPRAMPHVTITYAETSTTSLFGGTSGANYGLTTYTYGGKQGVTRATTAREVLPLIEALDGRVVTPDPTAAYPGYPLVTSADAASVWFYAMLPLLAVGGWWYSQRVPRLPVGLAGASVARSVEHPPWLSAYLPRLRTAAFAVGGVFLAIQVIPYGRSHTNFTVAPPSGGLVPGVADQYCPRTFAPGTESSMSLGVFRGQVTGMLGSLDGAQQALAANDAITLRALYGQFALAYAGVTKEIAELYPIRCPRLLADRLDGDAAILVPATVNLTAAAAPVTALHAGFSGISTELGARIQQASPDALVGNSAQTVDTPLVTGTPAWDTERTSALATRSCAACHSNQPGWSWYANVAPLSWLVQHDVDDGRRVLNFSEWDRPQPAAAQLVASVQQGRMPPAYAVLLNSDLQLSDAERAELVSGLQATTGSGPRSEVVSASTRGSAILVATLGTVLAALGFWLGSARRLSRLTAYPLSRPPQASLRRTS